MNFPVANDAPNSSARAPRGPLLSAGAMRGPNPITIALRLEPTRHPGQASREVPYSARRGGAQRKESA